MWCTVRDSNPGSTGYEPVALANYANGARLSVTGFEPVTKGVLCITLYYAKSSTTELHRHNFALVYSEGVLLFYVLVCMIWVSSKSSTT